MIHTSAGSHGTTKVRADSIHISGFRPSSKGRRGKGVYFWYADTLGCEDAKKLAIAWYDSAIKKGDYSDEKQPCCAVLWVELSCDQSNVLELANPRYRSYIRRLLDEHVPNSDKPVPDEIISSVHDMFIERMSKNIEVDMVLATVTAPKMSDKLKVALGDPFAYIVRNPECIKLNPALTEVI